MPQVTGLSREEFIFDHMQNPVVATLSYPAADLDPTQAKLTVRQREADPRVTPAGLRIQVRGTEQDLDHAAGGIRCRRDLRVVYHAKDPKVMGLAFAATRDIVSFLRHESADAAGTPNPLAGRIDRAIGFGVSQSGRYLHDFLYLGFNEDEAGRAVFEGLMPHLAGGKRIFTNSPLRPAWPQLQQHADTLIPARSFPSPIR